MAKEKQGMILPYKWIPFLKAIDPNSPAVKMLERLAECDRVGECEDIESDNALEVAVFGQMKEETLENRNAYVRKCEQNKANGLMGGRPKANGLDKNPKKPNGFSEKPKKPDYDYDCDKEKEIDIYSRVVGHLNESAGTNYRPSSKTTRGLIKARVHEGFKYEDFVTVIDKKVSEWSGTEMQKFLRPETLFGSKFEGYLNQKITKQSGKRSNFTEREYTSDDFNKIAAAMERR